MYFDRLLTDYDLNVFYFILCAFSFFSTAHLFCCSLGIKIIKNKLVFLLTSGLLLSLAYMLLKQYNEQLPNFLLFLFIPLVLSFISENRLGSSIIVGLISLSIFQIAKVIATLAVAVIFWSIGYTQKDLLVYTVALVIASTICVLFMKIKRFKRGVQIFNNEKHMGLGLMLSSVVFAITCIDLDEYNDKDIIFVILISGVIVFGFGLFIWIKSAITARYREHLQSQSEEHYQEILEERDKEIEKLNQSNAYLAKIVHRDNHLMSNVNTSIDMYFNSDDEADKETLLRELQTLAKERSEVINKEQLESKLLPSTGNLLIDGAINDLYIKAAAHGIDFNLTVTSTVDEIIGKYISQTDLQTLLCDHIKDAIIAVDSYGESGGKILVNLSKQNDNYCIDIYDSGVAFKPDTLSKLGRERVTTHADSGGSGIGFMTTFETLKKAYVSLIITEFDSTMPFTKSVVFRFDGESSFIIQSHRSEELKEKLTRDDVVIL